MTETYGWVKTPGSRTRPAGAHRPVGARPCGAQPHRLTAAPARQGATARQETTTSQDPTAGQEATPSRGATTRQAATGRETTPSRSATPSQGATPRQAATIWQGATAGQASQHGRGESASHVPAGTPAAAGSEAERKKRLSQRFLVLGLIAAVIVIDQAAKWWAWRHIPDVNINPGGDFLTGPTIGRWYANPVTGALLDFVDFALVSVAAANLARRRRRVAIMICGSLMVGGWASNLLDRLGMHYLTAPGSIRGAVDFIGFDSRCWNLADMFIVGATPLFLIATARLTKRAAHRSVASPAVPAFLSFLRARVPVVSVATAALVMTVALGAAHHGSLTKPSHASRKCCPAGPVMVRLRAPDDPSSQLVG